jgi:hypothetical protein
MMTWASLFSRLPAVAGRITDRTRLRWDFLALLVFQCVFVNEQYRIEHFFSCQRVLILLVVDEDCEIHWKIESVLHAEELQDTVNILFVNITPRKEVAVLISGTLLRWDGVVFHGARWDAIKGFGKCEVEKCKEVRAREKVKAGAGEMNAQRISLSSCPSREPKLLVNSGSPGYGHVSPYLHKIASFFLLWFPVVHVMFR